MRFRFTIRDLLWLTALVAVATCWWLTLAENKQLRNDLNKLQSSYKLLQSATAVRTFTSGPPATAWTQRRNLPVSIRDESVERAMRADRLKAPVMKPWTEPE